MKTLPYLFKKSLKSLSLFFLLSFLFFTNMQCKKDKLPIDKLPAATQTGANTFGCLVDGEAVTPTRRYIYNNNFNYGYDPTYGLSIEVVNEDNQDYSSQVEVKLRIANLAEGKTYLLTDYDIAGKGGAQYNRYFKTGKSEFYVTSSQTSGLLTIIKLDPARKIISGTFSFKATNTTKANTVNVTDGSFDLTFK